MDANYTPKPTAVPYTTARVELQMQVLARSIPDEWCIRYGYDDVWHTWIVELSRLVGELDSEKVDVEYGYVPYTHTVDEPRNTIDYLRVWLTKTFPLMTAPLWQPRYKAVRQYGDTVYPVKTITKVTKVVAPHGTHSYRYPKIQRTDYVGR